jgi:argininosuccinate lyase
MTLWAGRTGGDRIASEVREFLRGEDAELLSHDCEGTRLHAGRLLAAGILTEDEYAKIERRLTEIAEKGEALLSEEDEDIHAAIERLLGPPGRKIHAGRSRNDQVATALRLYVQEACDEALAAIARFATVVIDRAEAEADTLIPGYTHLQRAQPVTLGHHLLAWVEMLDRDRARFRFARGQAESVPLGAGALAGSTLPLPGPEGQMRNSLDAVADRDFALDYLYAVAVLFSHLSRIGEELCLWSSAEFGFVRLPEVAATGSSMMPQKLNPDVPELARGKAGTAIGRLTGLLATIKGLPLTYNLDLQEDKPPVFAARRDVRRALAALATLVGGLELARSRMTEAASDPLLLATDAAEELVRAGTPFRDAHEQVAARVREGTFSAPGTPAESVAARAAPGPGGIRAALAEARGRFPAQS